MKRRKMARRYNNLGEQVIKKEKYNNLGQLIRNSNNAADDEFGFDHGISEERYNKLRAKEQKKSMPQPQKKPKKRKRNPFMIGSDARPWKGLFGLKKWLIK